MDDHLSLFFLEKISWFRINFELTKIMIVASCVAFITIQLIKTNANLMCCHINWMNYDLMKFVFLREVRSLLFTLNCMLVGIMLGMSRSWLLTMANWLQSALLSCIGDRCSSAWAGIWSTIRWPCIPAKKIKTSKKLKIYPIYNGNGLGMFKALVPKGSLKLSNVWRDFSAVVNF